MLGCSSSPVREDKRQFKVGDCFAWVMRMELVDGYTNRYLSRPTAKISDVVFKITSLDDKHRLYMLVYQGGPYNGLVEAKDYDFADANFQRLNCDEKYDR